MKYDPDILVKFAEILYLRSTLIYYFFLLAGIFMGCALGLYAFYLFKDNLQNYLPDYELNGLWLSVLLGGIIGGILGVLIGWFKSFPLKLEAQKVLCQVKIEEGIRKIYQFK